MVILLVIITVMVLILIIRGIHEQSKKKPVTNQQEKQVEQHPAAMLLDLNTTTVAERQRAYKHTYRQQLLFDAVQREAEAKGDTATLEAIRLGTYTGPFPELKEDIPHLSLTPKIILGGGDSDALVQKHEYFCIKDKGYHVSVWPKDHYQIDIVEFSIAGMSHRDNIDNYLGEFVGTLEPEPTNQYDPKAIKVLAPDGHHVGYVPKDITSEVRTETSLPCSCFCYIGCNDGTYFSDCYILRK